MFKKINVIPSMLFTLSLASFPVCKVYGHEHRSDKVYQELDSDVPMESFNMNNKSPATTSVQSIQNVEIPLGFTDWSRSVSIPRFSEPGRVLNQAILKLTGTMVGRQRMWNRDTIPWRIELDLNTTFQSRFSGTPADIHNFVIEAHNSAVVYPISRTIPRSVLTIGQILSTIPSFDTGVMTLTESQIQNWNLADGVFEDRIQALSGFVAPIGASSSIQLDVKAIGRSRYSGPGDFVFVSSAQASAMIEIEYESSPAQCAHEADELKEYYFESNRSNSHILPTVRIGTSVLNSSEVRQLLSGSPIGAPKGVSGKHNPVLKLAQLYIAAQISISKGAAYKTVLPSLRASVPFLTLSNLSAANLSISGWDAKTKANFQSLQKSLERFLKNDRSFNDGIACQKSDLESEEHESSVDHDSLDSHSEIRRHHSR